jgi:hypothetical protein
MDASLAQIMELWPENLEHMDLLSPQEDTPPQEPPVPISTAQADPLDKEDPASNHKTQAPPTGTPRTGSLTPQKVSKQKNTTQSFSKTKTKTSAILRKKTLTTQLEISGNRNSFERNMEAYTTQLPPEQNRPLQTQPTQTQEVIPTYRNAKRIRFQGPWTNQTQNTSSNDLHKYDIPQQQQDFFRELLHIPDEDMPPSPKKMNANLDDEANHSSDEETTDYQRPSRTHSVGQGSVNRIPPNNNNSSSSNGTTYRKQMTPREQYKLATRRAEKKKRMHKMKEEAIQRIRDRDHYIKTYVDNAHNIHKQSNEGKETKNNTNNQRNNKNTSTNTNNSNTNDNNSKVARINEQGLIPQVDPQPVSITPCDMYNCKYRSNEAINEGTKDNEAIQDPPTQRGETEPHKQGPPKKEPKRKITEGFTHPNTIEKYLRTEANRIPSIPPPSIEAPQTTTSQDPIAAATTKTVTFPTNKRKRQHWGSQQNELTRKVHRPQKRASPDIPLARTGQG